MTHRQILEAMTGLLAALFTAMLSSTIVSVALRRLCVGGWRSQAGPPTVEGISFVLTNDSPPSKLLPTMSAADVRTVQTCYPQIYLACHTRHVRAASSAHKLSARDSSLLSHLDEKVPVPPAALARHLGVSPSTLSAAVKRLVKLANKGAAAMRATSVLDAVRVQRLLAALTVAERRKALEGLALLARAARATMEGEAGA